MYYCSIYAYVLLADSPCGELPDRMFVLNELQILVRTWVLVRPGRHPCETLALTSLPCKTPGKATYPTIIQHSLSTN